MAQLAAMLFRLASCKRICTLFCIINHHAPDASSTTMHQMHHQPPCTRCIINHHAPDASSTTMHQMHHQPPCTGCRYRCLLLLLLSSGTCCILQRGAL
jgi:hypothetical protein